VSSNHNQEEEKEYASDHIMKSGEKTANPNLSHQMKARRIEIIRKKLNYDDPISEKDSLGEGEDEDDHDSDMPGSPKYSIFDRFAHRRMQKQYWTKEEDDKLQNLVNKHGAK